MMDSRDISQSLLGGYSGKLEQDFHYGAKAKPYLSHPGTPPHQEIIKNDEVKDEWMDSFEYLGENFNPFEDVLIPDSFCVDPDELFKEIQNENIGTEFVSTPQGLSANPFPVQSQSLFSSDLKEPNFSVQSKTWENEPEIENSRRVPPKILVNLRKVKIIKPSKTTTNFQVSSSTSRPEIEASSSSQQIFTTEDQSKENVKNYPIINSNMTFKQLIEMDCGNQALDELMKIDDFNIFSDSDSSSGSDSPSYSSSSDSTSFSPEYESPSVNNLDFSTIDDDALFDVDMPSTSKSKKPYARQSNKAKMTLLEKKMKKMEQNKRAATRYRAKKKKEENEVFEKLRAEEERHEELTKRYKGLKQEVKMMKKIMRDLFIARGVISAKAFDK